MERDFITSPSNQFVKYFNSHAHVERDPIQHLQKTGSRISTHTLTWSVTYLNLFHLTWQLISTHTLTWSVTWCRCTSVPRQCHFNSHAHVERDRMCRSYPYQRCDFNSHAHVERDHCYPHVLALLCHFNSHAHVERDHLHLLRLNCKN